MLLGEALARELQSKEEWKSSRQTTWEMEGTEERKQLKQREREKQLSKEFENMQRQLSEELQEQLECSYQQKIKQAHRISKQTRENYITPEWSQIKLRENSDEVRVPAEQVSCWRCSESGHRKKECWKYYFAQIVANRATIQISVDKWHRKVTPIVKA